MKKLLGLALVASLFASCSDDDESSVDMGQLTKKWYAASYTIEGVTMPDENEPCGKDNIEFVDGGVFRGADVYDCNGTTPVSDTYNGTYSVNGQQVTINADGDSTTATVNELNGSTLKITYEEDWVGDGTMVTIVETYTSTP